jgi:DNA-binding MarR family transcriptional regulator
VELGDLTDHVGYLVRRAQIAIFQDFTRTLAPLDVRPAQYSVLTVIAANPGLTQMALAHALGIERSRLVHLLDALEERKWIQRLASKVDRRSHALHLTSEGEAALAEIKALAAQHERHVEALVGSRRRKELLRLLSPLVTGAW